MIESSHPTPQLEREGWRSLDGEWDFAFDDEGHYRSPNQVDFNKRIVVPYPPESPASGIGDEAFHSVVWYRRRFPLRAEGSGRTLVHFGAVDYEAVVWANGQVVAAHQGGHTPFTADVTTAIAGRDELELVVRAKDDPHDLAKPRGKQDWLEEPHAIWYPRTTGIWQTVWLEQVPETRIENLSWTPHLERWEIAVEAQVAGPTKPGMAVRVRLSTEEGVIADDRYSLIGQDVSRRISLPDPGIDDYRNELLWSPYHPRLIEAQVELLDGDTVVDRVRSYTAMRSVGLSNGRFMLNGRPFFLRMVLDQGYWQEGVLAATDEQLRQDVELTKRLGFNGARKHQKVENPRWLYWCDVYGLLVWEEMPSTYRFTQTAVSRLVDEWTAVIRRDSSHPCIVAWVPLNESWGVPDLPSNPAHRDFVRTVYHLTKTLDPTRPVVGNDGWEHVATDIFGVHDYDDDPAKLQARYGSADAIARINTIQPGDRSLALDDFQLHDQPIVISEFGGIAFAPHKETSEKGWGYSRARDADSFLEKYGSLVGALHECRPFIAGFCYTQLTDTYQEKNGLLFMDRSPKADLAKLFTATRPKRKPGEIEQEPIPDPLGYSKRWRQRRKE